MATAVDIDEPRDRHNISRIIAAAYITNIEIILTDTNKTVNHNK